MLLALSVLLCAPCASPAADEPRPRAPEGFAVDLVLAAPEILWPSANLCLDDGSLLVGEDRMDMPGPSDQPLDRLILLRFGSDGRVEKRVFAEKLYAIFGLELVDGAVYVMNMPFLTRLVDSDGDGTADERTELLSDLGPPAPGWPGGFNDHIVSGIRLSHDGWLYVAVGDKGIPLAHGTDGSTLTLRGGGVVRLRPDGSRLELVASGLRNILDVAIDAHGELFTHDNTDDGLGWWTRLTHVVYGGYYGYPWDYREHPERMLPCMKDYGGGSPTGGLVYREGAWPAPYAGSLFFCEWAKQSLRRFEARPAGATFEVAKDEDFLSAGDVQEFRPTDVCESPDGRFLYVSDWGYGGWTNPAETGRIWRVRRADDDPRRPSAMQPLPEDVNGLVEALGDASYRRRLRAQRALGALGRAAQPALKELLARPADDRSALHALWALADAGIDGARPELERVWREGSAQARRVVARIAGTHARDLRFELGEAVTNTTGAVLLRESLSSALERGRARAESGAVPSAAWNEPWSSFLARQLLRERGDRPGLEPRALATELLRSRHDLETVETLALRTRDPLAAPESVIWSLGMLAELARKPEPWDGKWWGTQPAKSAPPAHTVDWEGTPLVLAAIESCLAHRRQDVRQAALDAVRRIPDRGAAPKLRERYAAETEPGMKRLVLALLGELGDEGCAELLRSILADPAAAEELRAQAIESACAVKSPAMLELLVELARDPRAAPEQAARATRALGRFDDPRCLAAATERLRDERPGVGAAAVAALVQQQRADAVAAIEPLLADAGLETRKAVLRALRKLAAGSTDVLLRAWSDASTRLEAALALCAQPSPRALEAYLALAGGGDLDGQKSAGAALRAIRVDVRAELEARAEARALPAPTLELLRAIYAEPAPLLDWELCGPFPRGVSREKAAAALPDLVALAAERPWTARHARAEDGFLDLELAVAKQSNVEAFARTALVSARARRATMRVGSDDMLAVWVNGALVHDHDVNRAWHEGEDAFEVELAAGTNEILLCIGQGTGQWSFNARIAGEGSGPLYEAGTLADPLAELRAWVLAHPGDPARGFRVFRESQDRAMCLRCHKVFGTGGEVGPELSDVGAKYPKEELLDSILRPSQRIVDGYEIRWLELDDGRTLFGLVKSEAQGQIVLYDVEGQLVRVDASEVSERGTNARSAMPDGLSLLLSREELADLVEWLATLRGAPK